MMEGGGDMEILLTGVGGALSALGRDIPVDRKEKLSLSIFVSFLGNFD